MSFLNEEGQFFGKQPILFVLLIVKNIFLKGNSILLSQTDRVLNFFVICYDMHTVFFNNLKKLKIGSHIHSHYFWDLVHM